MGGTAGTLFGRRRELEAALRLLDDTGIRAIELVGEAGIGKTAILDEAKIYRKLGVRSRTELAATLARADAEPERKSGGFHG